LLILGIVKDELRVLQAATFLVVAVVAFFLVGLLGWPIFAYTAFIALLDIILILLIFRGDVRLR
jgi:hypothetical protein